MTRLLLSGHIRGEHVYVDVWLEDGDDETLVGPEGLMLTLDQWHELRRLDGETEGAVWATTNAEFEDSIGREIGTSSAVEIA